MVLGARDLACVGQDRQQGEEVPGSVPRPGLGVAVPGLPRRPLFPDLVSTQSFLGLGPSHQAFLSWCPQGEDRAVDAVTSAVCSSPKPGLSFTFNSLGAPTIAVTCCSRPLFCLRTWVTVSSPFRNKVGGGQLQLVKFICEGGLPSPEHKGSLFRRVESLRDPLGSGQEQLLTCSD